MAKARKGENGWARGILRGARSVFRIVLAVVLATFMFGLWWYRPILSDLYSTGVGELRRESLRVASRMPYFFVRHVEVRGTELLDPESVVRALDLSDSTSVWGDFRQAAITIRAMPGVLNARVDPLLPNRLRVSVIESPPIGWLDHEGEPVLVTRDGQWIEAPPAPERYAHLPRIRSSGEDGERPALKTIHALLQSGLPWAGSIQSVDITSSDLLRVTLNGENQVLLSPGEIPLEAALVSAVITHRRETLGSQPGILDLRFSDLIVARTSPED